MPEAVIFDLDGVLADSEQLWNDAKREVVAQCGGSWRESAPVAMMGMSSPEWSAYMHEVLGVPLSPAEIDRAVLARMEALYRAELPILPGAREAVLRAAARWPLALASSSNREIIDLFLDQSGLVGAFDVSVSSEEVARGKPAPDVFLEAARQLGVRAESCVVVEDSSNGLRAAAASGAVPVAVPNEHYPPDRDALALAAVVLDGIGELTPALIERLL